MKTTATVAFDIIGTCFSLEKPSQKLAKLGAPAHALELWFAQTLRDAFALSHAGSYRPLKEVLEAELPRTLKMLGVQIDSVQMSHVVASFADLELQPDALESFKILREAGCSIVALTNGTEDSTRELLKRTVEADWSIKTDKTERPQVGSSEATLLKAENELQFQGELAGIEGREGLVGFALVEAPLSLDLSGYNYIEFYARSKEPRVVYTLLLKDEQASQDTGTLTFDQEFVIGTDWTKVKLPLRNFRPMIRGRLVDGYQLQLHQVRAISFEITRSKQSADSPIPLNFALNIGLEVYVTNEETAVQAELLNQSNGNAVTKTPEELGWSPGFFERTAGCFEGEPLVRYPQGKPEERNWELSSTKRLRRDRTFEYSHVATRLFYF